MAGVLTVETGIACNNRCGYCPLRLLRPAHGGLEPPTDELLRRIAVARDGGFDEVAFSGGEPTVRPDFFDLVASARAAGFDRVGVTTNARMFAYRDFAARALAAGLTGVSVSIHGPDAGTHDDLTGTPGSFAQMVKGLDHLRRAAADANVPLAIHSITILVPRNLGRLRDVLLLAGGLGARLHIVQPFTFSRENLHLTSRYFVALPDLARCIAAALSGGLPGGARVKPYNIPPCVLGDLGPVLVPQSRRLKTYRAFADGVDAADPRLRLRPVQFHRTAECDACPHDCPGFRIEQRPDELAVSEVLASARSILASAPPSGPRLTLAALDLVSGPGLACLLTGIRALEPAPDHVRLLWGGLARHTAAEAIDACREARVDELCLVVRPEALRLPDRGAWFPGNLAEVADALERLARPVAPSPVTSPVPAPAPSPVPFVPSPGPFVAPSPVPSLFIELNTLFAPEFRLSRDDLLPLLDRLRAAGGTTLFLSAAEVLDGRVPPIDAAFKSRVAADLPSLLVSVRDRGVVPVLVRADECVGQRVPGSMESIAAGIVPDVTDWSSELVRHEATEGEYGWVLWSLPTWLFRAPPLG